MVYTERTEKCISSKDNTNNANKSAKQAASQSATSKSCSMSSSSSSNAWSKQASSEDKWKYNNMVRDNRDKFNGLHFC